MKPSYPAKRKAQPWRPAEAIPRPPDPPRHLVEELRRAGRQALEAARLGEQSRIARGHEVERHLAAGYARLRAEGLKAA
jgi:hypothetical protein